MRVNFVGDMVLDSSHELICDESLKELLETGDYNVLNLEGPFCTNLSPALKSGPTIHQSSNLVGWLERYNFKILSLANNHIMDYGFKGLEQTIQLLTFASAIGAGNWADAYKPLIIDSNNIKVGLLSLTELQFGVLHDRWEQSNLMGCAWINHSSVPSIIAHLKTEVDFVVVLAHAGLEGVDVPLPEWRDCYKELINSGADIVIGSHPHVIQGYEVYNNKVIFYSTGNFAFCSDSLKSDNNQSLGMCVTIDFTETGFAFQVNGTVFKNDTISLVSKESFISKLNYLNTLLEEKAYLPYVTSVCSRHLKDYYHLFNLGGLIHPDRMIIKTIARYLLGRCNIVHLLNNLQCESHRWCICRALKQDMRNGFNN